MKKRIVYIGLFLIFIIGVISLIGTFAIDSTITEGNSSKADYIFNITLGDRTNREITIPSYDSKIVDIKISNPNEFNISYLLYIEGINSNISIINISDTEASGVLNSKNTNLIKVFIQNNSSSDITTSIKDIVGFEKEKLSVPSNNTSINKGTYYKVIVKSNDNTYGKVKPNIKLSTNKGTVKYTLVPNTGYQYKSNTCNGTVANNILTISNITNNASCEVVFEPIQVTVNFDLAGGVVETTYTEPKEYTYTVPATGTYKIELWGAQGLSEYGGKGGYTKGEIKLNQNDNFYVYVGGTNGYNGGGSSSNKSGGGATDVRLTTGTFDNFDSLKSRIMVAAGGGSVTNNDSGALAGNAGGLVGYDGVAHSYVGSTYIGTGASQSSGGKIGSSATSGTNGTFGIGGTGGVGPGDPNHPGCGGGGGYYGGGASAWHAGSGGGSSYISGYNGCDAISSDSTTSNIAHSGQSVHYSGKTFTNTVMIDGSGYAWTNTKGALQQMPNPTGGYYASGVGHSGDGVAKITLLNSAIYMNAYNTKYEYLPTPTKAGYSFEGWYTGENGTGTKVTNDTVLTNINNHTLHAYWIKPALVLYDYIKNNADTTTTIDFSKTPEQSNTNGIYMTKDTDSGKPVYYYRGNVDNRVIFANFCWRIVRTTETGGVKLIYDGVPSNGQCNNTGNNSTIGNSAFNSKRDDAKYVGYMYGSSIDDETYTDDSTIKKTIDTWYETNMTSYTSQLEDTVFCNDRSYTTSGSDLYFGASTRLYTNNTPTLKCQNARDKFTTETINGNGALKYPVGLITADEMIYAGGKNHGSSADRNRSFYLYTGTYYWSFSPYVFYTWGAREFTLAPVGALNPNTYVNESDGVRPSVSLKPGIAMTGSGTATNPFVIG